MDKLELTEEERRRLREQHRRSPRAKAADRIKAILLLSQGYTRQEIAAILLRDEETISQWRERYVNRKSLEDWLQDDYQGYGGKLSIEQEQAVETFVEENLVQDARQVLDFIQQQFSIEYQVSGIHSLLHRLDFSYKQTTHFSSKMNVEAQKGWQAIFEEALKTINGIVLYMDGVYPQHNSATGKAWIKTGKAKFIPSNTGRKRVNINGAYNVETEGLLRIKNNYYPKFKEFQNALFDFFDNLSQYADELKRFVGTKPHFFYMPKAALKT